MSDWVTITKIAESLPSAKDFDEAFYWICDNEDIETLLDVEAKLRNLDHGFEQLIADIADVREFFDSTFFDALARWGQHPDNNLSLIAEERGGSVFSVRFFRQERRQIQARLRCIEHHRCRWANQALV